MARLDRLRARRNAATAARTPRIPDAELRSRLDALEAMVEALQDSVDRTARRQDDRLEELTRRLEPGELARTLSDDARKRGI